MEVQMPWQVVSQRFHQIFILVQSTFNLLTSIGSFSSLEDKIMFLPFNVITDINPAELFYISVYNFAFPMFT